MILAHEKPGASSSTKGTTTLVWTTGRRAQTNVDDSVAHAVLCERTIVVLPELQWPQMACT